MSLEFKSEIVEFVGRRLKLKKNSRLKSSARFWLQMLRFYFRVDVEGVKNIPKRGGALIVPNHSGLTGADAVLLTYILKRETKRRARILAHRAFFDFSDTLREISESHGLKKASIDSGAGILKSDRLLIIFPEGESGNFKSSVKRYHLQKFKTGFLRMAIESGKPIIPCTIVGAEESSLNLGSIDLSRFMKNLRIPLPLNLVPLPAKWKITFHPPVSVEELAAGNPSREREVLEAMASKLRARMQLQISDELKKRESIFAGSLLSM